jgi:hypothetical protein
MGHGVIELREPCGEFLSLPKLVSDAQSRRGPRLPGAPVNELQSKRDEG